MVEYVLKSEKSEAAQSCPTPCNPMGCSLLGSSIHGIFQAKVVDYSLSQKLFNDSLQVIMGFPSGSVIKNPPAMQETQV